MSFELIAILLAFAAMTIGQLAAILTTASGLGALVREMRQSFEAMDARFEQTTREVNRGFDAMDARFEQTVREIGRGFDAMDARFEQTMREMNRSFEQISRTHRAIAGLVVQESEKIQALLRE